MTANVRQHIVPRNRKTYSFVSYFTPTGSWQTRQLRQTRFFTTDNNRRITSLKRRKPGAFVRSPLTRGSVTQSTVTLGFALVILIAVVLLGFFYLQQVFGTAAQGSDIQALESEIIELREQQRDLELQGAELRSIQAVEERIKELNLVSSNNVAYLVASDDRVALFEGL